jgi:mRNA-degrading endonuclease RelE of RelBE toxin-antitoxin system
MSARRSYRLIATPSYERDVRKLTKRNRQLLSLLRDALRILESDPYNHTRQHDIEKLTDVPPGEGQWRIRIGDYRIRYDVWGEEVELHSFAHRKDVDR